MEAEVDPLVADWLTSHAGVLPAEAELVSLVRSAFPLPAHRRLTRVYGRGLVGGYLLAQRYEREQRATDLALIEARAADLLALVRALRPP